MPASKPAKMTSMNISIPLTLRRHIDKRMGGGEFGNTSEYVRHLIRRDIENEKRIDRALLKGLDSPDGATFTPEWKARTLASLFAGLRSREAGRIVRRKRAA